MPDVPCKQSKLLLKPMNEQRFKTRREIADVFGVGVRMISHWMREGCPVIYTGRVHRPGKGCHPRFVVEDMEQWLRKRSEKKGDIMDSFFKKS